MRILQHTDIVSVIRFSIYRSPRPAELNSSPCEPRNKRKQFIPQQHGADDIDVVNEDRGKQDTDATEIVDQEKVLLKEQLKIMGEQLQKMQQRYVQHGEDSILHFRNPNLFHTFPQRIYAYYKNVIHAVLCNYAIGKVIILV